MLVLHHLLHIRQSQQTADVAFSLATPGATGTSQDLQGDFQALKDSLSRVKLPTDLRLNESRQGIQRKDQLRIVKGTRGPASFPDINDS